VILVTTAGKVGSAAARLIAQRDVPVRVLVRHPEKAADLAQAGVEIFPGDLDSPESIDQAMRGVSSVILVTAPVVPQELSVIDSAERAGVEHLVKITTKASADSPIARRRNQNEIEDALVASGLSHTLLRNNAYMQNFLMMAAGIAQTCSFRTATGDGRRSGRARRCAGHGRRRRRDRGLPGRPRRKDVLADWAGVAFGQRRGRDLHQGSRPTDHLSPHLV